MYELNKNGMVFTSKPFGKGPSSYKKGIYRAAVLQILRNTGLVEHKMLSLFLLKVCRSQWPRGRRCRSGAPRLLGLWVRIPPGLWMFIGCECCVLSRRGLCDELITRPEESYRLWCVVVCDIEISWMPHRLENCF